MPGLQDGCSSPRATAMFAKLGVKAPTLHYGPTNKTVKHKDNDENSDISSITESEAAAVNPLYILKCRDWLMNRPYKNVSSTATPPKSEGNATRLVAYTPSSSTSAWSAILREENLPPKISVQGQLKETGTGRILQDCADKVKKIITFNSAPSLSTEYVVTHTIHDEGKICAAANMYDPQGSILCINDSENDNLAALQSAISPSKNKTTVNVTSATKGSNSLQKRVPSPDLFASDELLSHSPSTGKSKLSQIGKGSTSLVEERVPSPDPFSSDVQPILFHTSSSALDTGSDVLQRSATKKLKTSQKEVKTAAPAYQRCLRSREYKNCHEEENYEDSNWDYNGSDDEDITWNPDKSNTKSARSDLSDKASEAASDTNLTGSQASDRNNSNVGCNENNPAHSILSYISNGDPESDSNSNNVEPETPKFHSRRSRKERNRLRNLGQQYKSSVGKIVKARACRPLPNCKASWCEIKKLTEEERQSIFSEYWSLGDFNKRAQYVSSRILRKKTKTSKRRDPENTVKDRSCTLEYSLIHKEERLIVSKSCFLATLDENDRFVRGLMDRRTASTQVPDDKRGKHPPSNKISDQVRQEVTAHIRKFPAYVSHYSRRHTEQLYLGSHLNVATMHTLYIEEGGTPLSYSTYLQIFSSLQPRLKFKTSHVDTCVTCDSFENSIKAAQSAEEKETLQQQHDLHVSKADFAYKCKKEDKEEAKSSSNKSLMLVFDLQQVLPCPFLTSGNVFYLRQLSVYNLTIFETTSKQAFNFMWDESVAGRGANEIASCMLTYINDFLPLSVKHLTLYSDMCSGQNKNSLMLGALALTVQQHPSLEIIDQKFLVSGHTHLECDQAHHQIETKKRKTNVALHHPQNYYDLEK